MIKLRETMGGIALAAFMMTGVPLIGFGIIILTLATRFSGSI
ncbi:hypothetical protein [Palleronia sp.]